METLESHWSKTNLKQGNANFLVNGVRIYTSEMCVDTVLRRGSQGLPSPWSMPVSQGGHEDLLNPLYLNPSSLEEVLDEETEPSPIDFHLRCRSGLFDPQDFQFRAPEYTPAVETVPITATLDSDSDLENTDQISYPPPKYQATDPLQHPLADSTSASDAPLIPEDSSSQDNAKVAAAGAASRRGSKSRGLDSKKRRKSRPKRAAAKVSVRRRAHEPDKSMSTSISQESLSDVAVYDEHIQAQYDSKPEQNTTANVENDKDTTDRKVPISTSDQHRLSNDVSEDETDIKVPFSSADQESLSEQELPSDDADVTSPPQVPVILVHADIYVDETEPKLQSETNQPTK